MTDFFGEPSPIDETYCALQRSEVPDIADAREFVKALWRETEPYLDSHVRARAARQFQQAYWEMYLCAALLDLGLPVTPRDSRRRRDEGPDLQLGDVDAWCEAIAVTAGTGPDAVVEAEVGKARSVPHHAIKLRLTSALVEKARKFAEYTSSGLVLDSEPCIVAINAAMVPSARKELDVPRIVASVFAVGWPTVLMDMETGAIQRSGYTHQPEVAKINEARVSTDAFLSGDCPGVSAVLYSSVDHLIQPASAGSDFVLVHNPNAAAPLRRGFIARGREYWTDGNELRSVDHHNAGT